MIDQKSWKKAVAIVRDAIHEMDPYGLLADGAPIDEFDSEILKIVGAIKSAQSEKEVTDAISAVLGESFEPEIFRPRLCKKAGSKIFYSLRREKII